MAEEKGGLKPEEHNADSNKGLGSQRQSFQQRWRKLTIGNQIVAVSNVLIAATTGLYVLVSILTWLTVSRSSKETSKQMGDLIKAANIQSGAATKNAKSAADFAGSADAINRQTQAAVSEFRRIAAASERSIKSTQKSAQAALDTSIETAHTDQRAWMALTQMSERPMFMNFGKTPAFNVTDQMLFYHTSRGENPPEDVAKFMKSLEEHRKGRTLDAGIVFPGQQFSGFSPDIPSLESSPEVVQGIYTVYLIGRIDYWDAFKKKHTTKFCGVWIPAAKGFDTGGPCKTWNYAD